MIVSYARGDYTLASWCNWCMYLLDLKQQIIKHKLMYLMHLIQLFPRLPFPILRIDSDDGGEFINYELFR